MKFLRLVFLGQILFLFLDFTVHVTKKLHFKFVLYNNISRIAKWMLITNDEESKHACGLRKALFQETQVFLDY